MCMSTTQEACLNSGQAYYLQSEAKPHIEKKLEKIDKRLLIVAGSIITQGQVSIPINNNLTLTNYNNTSSIILSYPF